MSQPEYDHRLEEVADGIVTDAECDGVWDIR